MDNREKIDSRLLILFKQQSLTHHPLYWDEEVAKIPIEECNEGLIENRGVEMQTTGYQAESLVRLGVFMRLEAMAKNLRILYGNDSITIYVMEGFRTVDRHRVIVNDMVNSGKVPEEERHSIEKLGVYKQSGGCVDIKIYDKKSESFIDLGEDEDETKIITFSKYVTETQRKNREMLLQAAIMAGLVNYPYAITTFCFGDQYYCNVTGSKTAIYSVLKTE